jgi:Co/Zn/Cd efflux system component
MIKQLYKSTYEIPKMDCPSEENIIRMKLSDIQGIKHLDFDLRTRVLNVTHANSSEAILSALIPLGFGARLSKSEVVNEVNLKEESHENEAQVLKLLLIINAAMFFIEIIVGMYAQSMGVISDSLDMLADAAVYFISLIAVGKSTQAKHRAAKISGYFQIFLASFVIIEAIRRFYTGSEPEGQMMILVSILALIANLVCLLLLSKHRDGEVHMKASWIFSSNDVVANVGVIVAGILVTFLGSNLPDLIIGIIVGLVVLRGAFTILKLSK